MILGTILLMLTLLTIGALEWALNLYQIWWTYLIAIAAIPLVYLLWFGLYIIFVFIWSLFLNKKKEINKPSRFYSGMVRQTAIQLAFLSNSRAHVTGLEKIPHDQKFLIVSNHTSNFDHIYILKEIKHFPLICVTKPENENIPICGPFIHRAGYIKIDRENDFKALSSIVKATNYIKNDIANICIAPEGTRSKNGELLPFKPGAFKIATKSGAPIVIVSILNCNLIHKNFPFKRTNVYFDVIDVIGKDQYENMSTVELSERVREEIKKQLELRKGERK